MIFTEVSGTKKSQLSLRVQHFFVRTEHFQCGPSKSKMPGMKAAAAAAAVREITQLRRGTNRNHFHHVLAQLQL